MKNLTKIPSFIFKSLLLGLICFASMYGYAQQQYPADKTKYAHHSIFLELAGNALFYSINYDYRFWEHVSVRAGFGRLKFFETSTLVPVMINYLLPISHHGSYLEVGAGPVFNLSKDYELVSSSDSNIAGTATIGYRWQPVHGFQFRISFTPAFSATAFQPWGGISFGHCF